MQCCTRFGLERGTIITLDSEEQLEANGIQMGVVPAWRYFM